MISSLLNCELVSWPSTRPGAAALLAQNSCPVPVSRREFCSRLCSVMLKSFCICSIVLANFFLSLAFFACRSLFTFSRSLFFSCNSIIFFADQQLVLKAA